MLFYENLKRKSVLTYKDFKTLNEKEYSRYFFVDKYISKPRTFTISWVKTNGLLRCKLNKIILLSLPQPLKFQRMKLKTEVS